MDIGGYEEGKGFNDEGLGRGKLVLEKKEIEKLGEGRGEIGYCIIGLKLYLKDGECKVLLGVGRGKKK
ncbi:SsrA-binding protein, partial [Staphylococcus epidermidis]|uniref:SsrA-binding protein n=1 Tax=Staphylococcus epidermidis TaxID=1282 RepID=UPI001642F4B5